MAVRWPDEVDEVIAGDAAAGFAYLTPANGVVVTPMAPLGIRDRDAGTVTVTSSQGLWKKLDRVRANPSVAVAYHAREHGFCSRPEFVLVQGQGSFPIEPPREWLESIKPEWERFLGPIKRGLRGRWLEVYYWQRVPITIEVKRVVVWPNEGCQGEPRVYGDPLPADPQPQSPPKKGVEPRVGVDKLAGGIADLPHSLLAWAGADGLPMVVSVGSGGSGEAGVELEVPAAVPAGGRRAGLTSHVFQPRMVGQEQRIHTGWLEVDGRHATYAPHTRSGYTLPTSQTLFTFGAGLGTRLGIGKARERGLAPKKD